MKTSLKFLLFVPVAIIVACLAWYFYGGGEPEKRLTQKEAEKLFAVLNRMMNWRKILTQREFKPKKFLIGTNINLDLIVSFEEFIKAYQMENSVKPASKDVINTLDDFFSTMSFYFAKGAAAERFVSSKEVFDNLTAAANAAPHRLHIGGNAALIAEFLASFQFIDVRLFGPVGHKLRPLMSQRLFNDLVEEESDQPDEIHLIIEYKAGEKFAELTAPIANRFIVHHDISNSELVHVNGFLEAATKADAKLDWTVWSGLHFLDSLPRENYMPHVNLFRKALENRKTPSPLHMELASMATTEFVRALYQNVVVFADSIGLNDQELMFLSKSIGGPQLASNGAVDKTIEAMVWILNNVRELVPSGRHLTRIHMHSHRFHVIAQSKKVEAYGNAEGVLHGAFTAAVRACRSEEPFLFDLSKPKLADGTVIPHHEDRHPVITWTESDDSIQLYLIPTILCRKPVGTVGLGDAISAAALVYSSMNVA